jgi:hypothetical protein
MEFRRVLFRSPGKRRLYEVLKEIGECDELASSIERASEEMRGARLREVDP